MSFDTSRTNGIILYPSALCNLRCKYCYIDKNPCLKEIDDAIEKSFQDNYYFDFAKKLFDKNKIEEMQFWGSEPLLGFHRLYNLIPNFIEYYPNLRNFMTSTNFTIENWEDEFFGFLNIFSQFPKRTFNFNLQLSIDGPEYINDKNRGKGVTQLFLEHFNSFVNNLDEHLPPNVNLGVHFKQTITEEDVKTLLTKEAIIAYFKFFDDLTTLFYKKVKSKNACVNCVVPNTAVPGYTTVADGKRFAEYTRLTYEISKENLTQNRIFENYNSIISFTPRGHQKVCELGEGCITFCGAGIQKIGLLPDEHICICHAGFVDYIEGYKQFTEKNILTTDRCININYFKQTETQPAVFPVEEFATYQKILLALANKKSAAGYINLALLIKTLAQYEQIDKKYAEEHHLKEAVAFLNNVLPNCIRNNINITGNILSPPIGLIKLLLNGAKEYIDAGENLPRRAK